MSVNGAPKDDRDVAYKLGQLTTALKGLTKSVDELRQDFKQQVSDNHRDIRDLRRGMLWDISKVATGIVIIMSGFVEAIKAML